MNNCNCSPDKCTCMKQPPEFKVAQQKKNAKKGVATLGLIVLAVLALANTFSKADSAAAQSPSDDHLMNRVVKLVGKEGGSCSGEQVRAPSGTDYILTAGHCMPLASDGAIDVITEDGRKLSRRVIAEDMTSDLALLEGLPNLEGIKISVEPLSRHQIVRTFTHGAGFDTYKTEGAIIQLEYHAQVLIGSVVSEDSCKGQKYKVVDTFFGPMCTLDVVETVSIAMTMPGSSGGMVVNARGELVGVVSAGNEKVSLFVTLKDIKSFLFNY